jgi:hypothetical protein
MRQKRNERKEWEERKEDAVLWESPPPSLVDQGINSAAHPQSRKIASGTAAHRQRFTFVGYAIE